MKSNKLALLGIAFGIAGAALLALFVSTSGTPSVDVPTAEVFVAAESGIGAGTTAENLGGLALVREIPLDVVPGRAITSTADIAGQRAVRAVGPGEILTTDQFAAPGPAVGGFLVPEGWEAVSVEAAPAPGLQGYATPGSLVNLYVTMSEPPVQDDGNPETPTPPDPRPFTQLVLGHTEVLAVTRGTLTGEAQQVADGQAAPGVFLLQVRPQDMPTLLFAQAQGSLWFTLANAEDPAPSAQRFFYDGLAPDQITAQVAEARAQLQRDLDAAEAARQTAEGADGAEGADAEDPSEAAATGTGS
ncbi:hypothetical protein BH23ACT9_BH23ACT9_36450 [soil metagenome]